MPCIELRCSAQSKEEIKGFQKSFLHFLVDYIKKFIKMRLSYIVSSVVLIFLVASGESFVHAPYQVSRKTKKSNSEDYIEQSQTFFKKQKK